MATKSTYQRTLTHIEVTIEEIEQLLIAKYANLPLTAVPDVEFNIQSGQLASVCISYEVHEPVAHSLV